jgi:hypothetical protein
MIKSKCNENRSHQRQKSGDEKAIKDKDIVIRSEQSKDMVKRKRSKGNEW